MPACADSDHPRGQADEGADALSTLSAYGLRELHLAILDNRGHLASLCRSYDRASAPALSRIQPGQSRTRTSGPRCPAAITPFSPIFSTEFLPKTADQTFRPRFLSFQEHSGAHHGYQAENFMRQTDEGPFSGPRSTHLGKRQKAAFIWRAMTALLLSTMPARPSAKIEVAGQWDALRLTAEDASIDEILAALSAKFNLTYSSEPQLDRTVAGAYSGTLQQVMGRVLDGYD